MNISKNGISSLKYIIAQTDFADQHFELMTSFADWHHSLAKCIKKGNSQNLPKDYTKFVVLRDPYERFFSAIKNKGISVDAAIDVIKNHKILVRPGFNKFMCADQHFRLQHFYITYSKLKINYFVKFEDLDSFLENQLNVDPLLIKKLNSEHFENVDTTLTDAQKQFLDKYFKPDYDLLATLNNKNKWWKK